MTEVPVTPRAAFPARVLATLVAFELGPDTVTNLLRAAAEEFGLTRLTLWSAGSGDGDGLGERRPLGEYAVPGAPDVPDVPTEPGVPDASGHRPWPVPDQVTAAARSDVPGLPDPALGLGPIVGAPGGHAVRTEFGPAVGSAAAPDAAGDTATADKAAPADAAADGVTLDLPVPFGDRVVARLVASGPAGTAPAALEPLLAALGLLIADRGPQDRAATLARRFEDRRFLIETIMEQLPVGVAVTNTAGVFQLVNHRMSEIFGPGLTGMAVRDWTIGAAQMSRLDGAELAPADMPLVRALADHEAVDSQEYVFHAAGGADRIVTVGAAPVLDADGGLLAAVVTAADVTESHEAAAALAAARADLAVQVRDLTRLQRLVDSLSRAGDLPRVFAELLEAVTDLLGASAAVIMTREPETGDLYVSAARGLAEHQVAAIASLDQSELLTSRRAMAGFDAYISDVESDPRLSRRYRAVVRLIGAVSVHSIPLRTPGGEVVGTIGSFFDHPYHPSRRELSMIRTCAGIGSQLIANANARVAEQAVAEELQKGMLPRGLPNAPGVELEARYRPATAGMLAGGDWYDVTWLPGGMLGFTIGDVVGHGVEAASDMGQLRAAVRAYALTTADQPADLVRKVKAYVTSTGVGEMATLAFLTLDPAARKLRVASAGHFPPLLLTPGGAWFARECGLTTPLGVYDPDGESEAVLELGSGTTVVLYTDGLVERRGHDLNEGLERLRAVAGDHRGSVEDLCDHLLLELLPEGERSDDVALLAFRV